MTEILDVLIADGVIDEVLGRLKSGKEADISLVRRGTDVIAAKVYKDRTTRSFKNNSDYKEGRKVRNSRTQRAIEGGGRFGRDAAEQAWKSAEVDALYKLAGSGVRVPEPVMFYEGVLLMTLVLDAEGRAAPRLIDVAIERDDAMGIYADLVAQIISMLCCDLIHGDLSPYNILAAADGPTIIDFPQVISAAHSSRAEYFFLRDFDNIVRFLAGFDPSLAVHTADGRAIWRAHVSRELTPQFVPPPPPPPRAARPRSDERGRRDDRPHRFGGPPSRDGRPQQPRNGQPQADGRPRDGQQRQSRDGQQQQSRDGRPPQSRDYRSVHPRDGQSQQSGEARPEQSGDGHRFRESQPPQSRDGQPPQSRDGQQRQSRDGQQQQSRDGRPPQSHDGRPPQSHDGRPPQSHDGRPPQSHDGRPPQSHDGRPPQSHDGRPPQIRDGRSDQARDGQSPQPGDGRPQQSGEGRARRRRFRDGQPPSRDGQQPQSRDGRPPQSSDGRPPQSSDGRPPQSRDGRSGQPSDGRSQSLDGRGQPQQQRSRSGNPPRSNGPQPRTTPPPRPAPPPRRAPPPISARWSEDGPSGASRGGRRRPKRRS